MSKTENAAKTENTQLAAIMPDMFGKLEFSNLNSIIEKLGERAHEISEDDKKYAVQAVESWQRNVIEKLQLRKDEANEWLNFLNGDAVYCSVSYSKNTIDTAQVSALTEALGLKDLHDKYIELSQKIEDAKGAYPSRPVVTAATTMHEKIVAEHDYELACAEVEIQHRALFAEQAACLKKLRTELNKKPEIKELKQRLSAYSRNARKMLVECDEKAQLAKLNISINDGGVKDALRELIDFSANI